ncbi:MAG: CPBP family intramembrane metalloprotease [Alphaproteobacteria bacterium]|nr:CPBP family intramembrane metalloprotease [Alphaproteobacteria bacterium]
MNIQSVSALFPYLTLGFLITGMFIFRSQRLLKSLIAAQLVLALAWGVINWMGLLAIGIFWGICELHWCYFSSKGWLASLRLIIIVAIALGFANHLIPGFYNLRAINNVYLSLSSAPFTMYLNFDKTAAALILAVTSSLIFNQTLPLGKGAFLRIFLLSGLCISVLIPIALYTGYVHYDFKIPDSTGLWIFNNMLFVCFAEEVIFRGIIQNYLMQISKGRKIPAFIPITVTSLLFGVLLVGHLKGGITFIAFATIAGMFYGYAYHLTNRLEAAMLVHFIVNLCHFLFFSYPMAAILNK